MFRSEDKISGKRVLRIFCIFLFGAGHGMLVQNHSSTPLCFDSLSYDAYITTLLRHLKRFQEVAAARAPRRWDFETYKAEQRAGDNLCTRVKALFVSNTSDEKRPILIVWGDGGFGPTSRGLHQTRRCKRFSVHVFH